MVNVQANPDYDTFSFSFPNSFERGNLRRTASMANYVDNSCEAHVAHDEAAVNHMMAERRRRMKQKENFATLRKLVPIISKVLFFACSKFLTVKTVIPPNMLSWKNMIVNLNLIYESIYEVHRELPLMSFLRKLR